MEIKKLPKEAISFSCPIFWGRMRFPPSALRGLFFPSRLPSLWCGEFLRAEALYPCRTQNRRRDVAAHLCDCLPLGAAHCPPLCGKFRTGDGNGVRGTYIFAAAFLLMGFNLFASGFFAALNDGKTSASLSLFRTLISLILPLLIHPRLWGVDGVWISMPVAEVLSILLSVFYFRRMRNKYHYA